jgi:hypothetical protein
MTERRMPEPTTPEARHQDSGSEIRTFRLGDYGLIDVGGSPPSCEDVRRALLGEWSTSPAGVIIRLDTDEPPDDGTVGAIAADASALVERWAGTPIGLLSERWDLRASAAGAPRRGSVVIGASLTEIWGGLWSRGGKTNFTVELPPTEQAPRTARDIVVRACVDWELEALSDRTALLTGDLVARSVVQGAHDIHFTVSRHQDRIRVLARDDVPSRPADEPRTIDDVFGMELATPALSGLADSLGEFAFDGHHVRWAVTREHQAA